MKEKGGKEREERDILLRMLLEQMGYQRSYHCRLQERGDPRLNYRRHYYCQTKTNSIQTHSWLITQAAKIGQLLRHQNTTKNLLFLDAFYEGPGIGYLFVNWMRKNGGKSIRTHTS